jgi:GTP-binding protein
MAKPLVALVGRPNVGKSTLFNRLAGERLAVVDKIPGTTRDRLVAEGEWSGVVFDIVDTGGIDPSKSRGAEPLSIASKDYIPQIRAQAEMAMAGADAILFLVDTESGLTPADYEIAKILRRKQVLRQGKPWPPILVVANKCDNAARRSQSAEFYELGMGDPNPISSLHGTSVGDLLDCLIDSLGSLPFEVEEYDSAVKIAIVGRPNVGKSSLLNRLLGEERVIVSPIPGTTRDAIDTHLTYHKIPITLIDTAGIRRRGHIKPGVEKYSVLRALKAIERSDVVLLLIDATEGTTAQDTHIAGLVIDKMKSVVILVNKWDAVPKDSFTMIGFSEHLRAALNFLDYVPVLFISAKTGQRVGQVLSTALLVQKERNYRIPTADVNHILRKALESHAPPSKSGKRLKIVYGAQVSTDPPKFLFHVNDPDLVHFSYARYLQNQIRSAYSFFGTPIQLSFKRRSTDRKR